MSRILLTTDTVGGVWDFCSALTRELEDAGHQVTILALGEPPSQLDNLISAPLKLEWMADSAADVRLSQQLLRDLVADLKPDVVHANQFALAAVPLDVPVVLTAHSDVFSWHKWVRRQPAGPEWDAYKALVQTGLREANAVVAVSAFLASELTQLYSLTREVEVIHNGIPLQPRPGGGPRQPLTMLAGRAWDPAKNIPLAAAAAQGQVVFAGPLESPDTGETVELGPKVRTLGHLSQPDLLSWLGQARVYLSPALYDPFGLLPVQAALSGCALLLSDIPSYRELWDGAAVFFRPEDDSDLRTTWRALLEDDDLCRRMAAHAHRRATERYDARRMAGGYTAAYLRVTERQLVAAS